MSKSRTDSATCWRRSNQQSARDSKRAERKKAPSHRASGKSNPSKAGADSKKPTRCRFLPEVLDPTVIAIPLLTWFADPAKRQPFDVVGDLNLNYRDGLKGRPRSWKTESRRSSRRSRRGQATAHVAIGGRRGHAERERAVRLCDALREGDQGACTARQRTTAGKRAIHHIWPDFPLKTLINRSISTVKAARPTTRSRREGPESSGRSSTLESTGLIPHFTKYHNLDADAPPRTPRLHRQRQTARGHEGARHPCRRHHRRPFQRQERRWRKERRIVATMRYRDHNGDPAEAELTPALTFDLRHGSRVPAAQSQGPGWHGRRTHRNRQRRASPPSSTSSG